MYRSSVGFRDVPVAMFASYSCIAMAGFTHMCCTTVDTVDKLLVWPFIPQLQNM